MKQYRLKNNSWVVCNDIIQFWIMVAQLKKNKTVTLVRKLTECLIAIVDVKIFLTATLKQLTNMKTSAMKQKCVKCPYEREKQQSFILNRISLWLQDYLYIFIILHDPNEWDWLLNGYNLISIIRILPDRKIITFRADKNLFSIHYHT
jgi:hypothetical protein